MVLNNILKDFAYKQKEVKFENSLQKFKSRINNFKGNSTIVLYMIDIINTNKFFIIVLDF